MKRTYLSSIVQYTALFMKLESDNFVFVAKSATLLLLSLPHIVSLCSNDREGNIKIDISLSGCSNILPQMRRF
jgi:hypothetical protein